MDGWHVTTRGGAQRLLLALASIGLCSCYASSGPDRAEGITLAFVSGDSGMGLSLRVENSTASSICIPIRSLAANSGSVVASRNGREFFSPNNAEYAETMPGFGPFYIVTKGSSAVLPVDEGGLKLMQGTYLFRGKIMWMSCDKIISARSYSAADVTEKNVQTTVSYAPFG